MLAAISAIVLVGAMGYLIGSSINAGDALEYFKDVHEVLDNTSKWQGKRLRLRGNIVAGTIQKKISSLDYRFAMFTKGRWVEVTYRGLVPDTFKDCAEVVVRGKLIGPNHFSADEITAKCPSKYSEKQRVSGCGTGLKPAVLAARGQ